MSYLQLRGILYVVFRAESPHPPLATAIVDTVKPTGFRVRCLRAGVNPWCQEKTAEMSGLWELIVFVVLVAIVSGGGTLLVMSVVNKPTKPRSASTASEATLPIAADETADLHDTPGERRAA
jgi:hypothetical protein